jgi:hypothetical protein
MELRLSGECETFAFDGEGRLLLGGRTAKVVPRDIVKVGRSDNPERRRRQLERGQAFSVEILATFPGQGALEGQCARRWRPTGTRRAGRGWFSVSAAQAIAAITALL